MPIPASNDNLRLSSSRMTIRNLTEQDLTQVARIHLEAFPDSALTRLGADSVKRYYHWQLTGPHRCVALAACDGDRIYGFAFAGQFSGALGGFLQRNKWILLSRTAFRPWLVFNPIFRDRIHMALRSLSGRISRRRRGRAKAAAVGRAPSVPSFGILSIAVSPSSKRRGAGSMLMARCEEYAREWNLKRMHLSVATDNLEAIRFYERIGWKKEPSVDAWQGLMIKELL